MFPEMLASITTCVVSMLLWPLLLVVTLVNELIRICVRYSLPKNYELTEDCFGSFLWSDLFNSRMVVVALYSPDNADLEKDVEKFQKVLNTSHYSNLKKTQVGKYGYACQRLGEGSFEVSNHVKLFDMAAPANKHYFTEEEIYKIILPEYMSSNMDETKPQWEWLVFPRVQRENGTFNSLRVFRFDHRYMDGASAGLFMAEAIFDSWGDSEAGVRKPGSTSPPYVFNPKNIPPNPKWWLVAKAWALLHLPLIVLLSLLDLYTLREGKGLDKPFTAWRNKGRKVFSRIHALDVAQVKGSLGNGNRPRQTFLSAMLTSLAPVLGRARSQICMNKTIGNRVHSDTVNVSAFQALPPYKYGSMTNQFTILQTKVPLKSRDNQALDFPIDITFLFPHFYIHWIGRLPISWIRLLGAPTDATVALNSIPYLNTMGSISGSKITEIASWDCLYTPVGLDITVMGYRGTLFISAFSVEECLSFENINDILENYVLQLKGKCD